MRLGCAPDRFYMSHVKMSALGQKPTFLGVSLPLITGPSRVEFSKMMVGARDGSVIRGKDTRLTANLWIRSTVSFMETPDLVLGPQVISGPTADPSRYRLLTPAGVRSQRVCYKRL